MVGAIKGWLERRRCPHLLLEPLTIRRYIGSAPVAVLNCRACGHDVHVKLRGLSDGSSEGSIRRSKDIQMDVLNYALTDEGCYRKREDNA